MDLIQYFRQALVIAALPTLACANFVYWKTGDTDTATIPKTLSAMGLYSSITPTINTLLPSVNHFNVNSPLWSDGAHKNRWFMLKPGKSIGFKLTDDYYDYPDSAVFIKQFDIDTIVGDSTSRVRWETRILYNVKDSVGIDSITKKIILDDHWYGYSYKWNAAQTDANLIGIKEQKDSIRTYPNGKGNAAVMKKWVFPSRSNCAFCHRVDRPNPNGLHGRSILGFFTAQLNGPHPDSTSINQLEYFFSKGLLTGTKPSNWNYSNVPRWAGITDSSASPDLRARSYIAANCSGCHGARGIASYATPVTLNYDFHTMTEQMEFRQHLINGGTYGTDTAAPFYYKKTDRIANPLANDSLSIQPTLVIPGYPTKSIILARQKARNSKPGDYYVGSYAMPPLASYEVNVPAMAVISEWITNMFPVKAPNCCPAPEVGIQFGHNETFAKSPSIQGHVLKLPLAMTTGKILKVSMTSTTGKTIELKSQGSGQYLIPDNLAPGIYFFKAGNQIFQRQLF